MKGIITHTIKMGDSLQKLARAYGVRDWREIAEINELHAPYIDAVYGSEAYKDDKYVACVGDTIIIPSAEAYRLSESEQDEVEAEAYGFDLALYHDNPASGKVKGNLEYDRDVKVVSGLGNLAQQLMSRLSVKQGALLLHPEYGSNLHKYYGTRDSLAIQNKIIFEVERCLRTDFRVRDIQDLAIERVDGTYVVTARIIPIPPGKPFAWEYRLKE